MVSLSIETSFMYLPFPSVGVVWMEDQSFERSIISEIAPTTSMLLEGVNLAAKTASYLKKVSNLFRQPSKIPIFSGPWFTWSGIWRCSGHHDWWGYSWLLLRHSQVIIMVMENGSWLSYLRSVKTGAWQVSQLTGEEEPPMSIAGHVDVGEQYNCIINLFSWTEVLYLTNMCSGIWTSCVNHHWAALPQNNSAGVSQFSPATIFWTTPSLRSIVQTVSEHLQQAGES